MEIKNCKIFENREIAKGYFLLEIENNFDEKFKPGQFIMIKIPFLFLRRPFSILKTSDHTLSILYKITGKGTEILSQMKKKEVINVLGPCGNGFKISNNIKEIWIVAGGTGIAPVIFLSEELIKKNTYVTFFYGARKKEFIFFEILPPGIEYIFSTDDGSYGRKGSIFSVFKNFLRNERPDIVYSAGPEKLLKKVSATTEKEKIPCFITLENYMGCGMGLCFGCVVKIGTENNWEYKRVCKEGPVFESRKIVWK